MCISKLIYLKQNRKRLDYIRKNRKHIIPFVGAGISVSCGLYTWQQLLDTLASEYLTKTELKKYKYSTNYLEYAEAIVSASGNPDAVMRRIGEIFEERDIHIEKSPYLLVSSFSNNIVTTNYDQILETAAKKFRNKDELKVLLPCLTGQMTAAIQENQRAILKMHGSIEESSSMVFSESQYDEFYRDNMPLPMFLETFFSGKSILFVGCSLTKDRTMDILAKCIKRNRSIRHYAIIELPQDPDEEITQRNYLTSIGIDPIYYPAGDYESVELLLAYLAEDNSFIKEAKHILSKYVNTNHDNDIFRVLISIINESYYNTAKDYPELLELNGEILGLSSDYEASIDANEKASSSLYDICITMFDLLSRSGISSAYDIKENLINHFAEAALRETDIRQILQKQYTLRTPKPLDIEGKSDDELTKLADKLNRKIQYEPEMGFQYFIDNYNQAIDLLDHAYERIEMHQRVLLCNTIGAWATYVLDTKKPEKYLGLAISTIESLDESEQPYGLLSKCYCNLALLTARNRDYKMAMKYAEKDLEYKQHIHENKRLYAGSLGHYALYQKECDPFAAIQTYIDVIKMKYENIKNADHLRYERDENIDTKTIRYKLIASWATSIFDLGLLAKDLLFYQLAHDFISLANEYRYKLVNNISKDYNSSCNVAAELAALLHQHQDIQSYINAVEGRINMNSKLSTTIYHSWYICSLYFYEHRDYDSAKHYIRQFYKSFYFHGDVTDIRQEVRAKLLETKILLKYNSDTISAQKVLDEAIEILKKTYQSNSFWFIEPYTLYENINNCYSKNLIDLKEKYSQKRENANIRLKQFVDELLIIRPHLE